MNVFYPCSLENCVPSGHEAARGNTHAILRLLPFSSFCCRSHKRLKIGVSVTSRANAAAAARRRDNVDCHIPVPLQYSPLAQPWLRDAHVCGVEIKSLIRREKTKGRSSSRSVFCERSPFWAHEAKVLPLQLKRWRYFRRSRC